MTILLRLFDVFILSILLLFYCVDCKHEKVATCLHTYEPVCHSTIIQSIQYNRSSGVLFWYCGFLAGLDIQQTRRAQCQDIRDAQRPGRFICHGASRIQTKISEEDASDF